MPRKKPRKTFDVSYHVVAFIDLMGQQERLRRMGELPISENSTDREQLINSLKETSGAVSAMRKNFNSYFETYKKRTLDLKGLPKEKRLLIKELTNNPIRTNQFSDFVVAFLSLRTDKGAKMPIRGIYGMIGAAAATSLTSLAIGHPIRGGMDIGVSIELKYNEIYGASLARAYALESHVANYPRVVIGHELYDYLIQESKQPQIDELSTLSAISASRCLRMLAVDDDGYAFVDFIGAAIKEEMGDQGNWHELVEQAYSFVLSASDEFQKNNNSKIAFKYSLLRNYMESRLNLWGIEH